MVQRPERIAVRNPHRPHPVPRRRKATFVRAAPSSSVAKHSSTRVVRCHYRTPAKAGLVNPARLAVGARPAEAGWSKLSLLTHSSDRDGETRLPAPGRRERTFA